MQKLLSLAMILAAACSELSGKSGFNAGGNQKVQPVPATFSCEPGTTVAQVSDIDINFGDQKNQAEIGGQFCPTSPADVHVLFILDNSYSMIAPEKPNDPVVKGSCGRLDAARAIVKRYKELVDKDTAEVKVTLVPFARFVITKNLAEQVPADDFEELLTVERFCAGIQGGTNYADAFNKAKDLFADKRGRTVAFFITDGMPTFGGGGDENDYDIKHVEAGEKAAKSFRQALGSRLTFNTVFVGNAYEEEQKQLGIDFEERLEELTGDKERFKVVKEAEKLAQQVLDLKPEPAVIDKGTVKATLYYADGSKTQLPIADFRPSETKKFVWVFSSNPFNVFSASGQKLTQIIIEAKDGDGETYKVKLAVK